MEPFLKNFLEPFSYFIYAITLWREYRRDKLTREKVLFIYYFLAAVIISYASVIALNYANNNWLYSIHYFLSAVIFAYYFVKVLTNRLNRLIAGSLFTLVLLIYFSTNIILENTYFNSIGTAVFFLSVLICSFLFFNELLNNMTEKNILLNFDFWLISGYVLYFLGSFFIILSYDYFSNKFNYDQQLILGNLWSIQNSLLFIASLLALGSHLWIAYQNKSL